MTLTVENTHPDDPLVPLHGLYGDGTYVAQTLSHGKLADRTRRQDGCAGGGIPAMAR